MLSRFSQVWFFVTLWTVADRSPVDGILLCWWNSPLLMEFSRQEYWSGLPFPSPNLGIETGSPVSPALAGRFFTHWATWEAPLYIMLSCFSRVWLCATPWTAAHQAPLFTGFSRQEHWSGLPFPSPLYIIGKSKKKKFFLRHNMESPMCPKTCSIWPWPLRSLKLVRGAFLVVLWIRLCFPMQGMKVRSLVGELRPTWLVAKKTKT